MNITWIKQRLKKNRGFIGLCNKYLFKNCIFFNGAGNCIDGFDKAFLKNTFIRVNGTNNRIILSQNVILHNCNINIYGNNCIIEILENVLCKNAELHMEDDHSNLKIGCNTMFTGKIQIAVTEGGRINIGSDCLFSSNIDIRNGDSHSIIDINTRSRINHAKDIFIGDKIWCGHSVIILKGSTIPNSCVIAAGSIVTSKFNTPNSILAGNPAKIVKRDIGWKYERI